MLTFIHLTDTHLIAPGGMLYGLDPQARLEAAVADIAARHGPGSACPAAFAVLTGDLTHHGEASAYHALGAALDRLPFPAHLLLGNHDVRDAFRAAFPDTPTIEGGFVQHAFTAEGVRCVLLDTLTPDGHHGSLCAARLAWLAAELAAHDAPVLLFLHHPPLPVGVPTMDRLILREAEALWDVLAPHRARLRHMFFGHLHRPVNGSWRGVPFSTIRGTSHQVALSFADGKRTPGSAEPPAYAVVRVAATDLVVHTHDFLDRTATFDL